MEGDRILVLVVREKRLILKFIKFLKVVIFFVFVYKS